MPTKLQVVVVEVNRSSSQTSTNICLVTFSLGSDAKTYHLCGLPVLKLTAELKSKKSNGPNSWQHSQLFRQPLNSRGEFPLDIIVIMKKKQA